MQPERNTWLSESEKMVIDEGKTWEQAAEALNVQYNTNYFTRPIVRNNVRRHSERWANGERSGHGNGISSEQSENNTSQSNPAVGNKVSKRKNKDGFLESDRLLELYEDDDLSDEDMLRFHKLDPLKWQVHTYTNNFWHAMTGKNNDNRRKIMCQSKLVARPKIREFTEADIDVYMLKKVFTNVKPPSNPLQYDPNGEVLEIDLPDLHGGLLAWIQETGADYDIHIATELFFACLHDIVERCKGRKFKKIILATLGDLCHIDNEQQTTTKGTPQQADGRIPKITDAIMDMLIDGITILAGRKSNTQGVPDIPGIAPVEVTYLPGNHDQVTGRMIMMSVCQAFRNDPNVTFDMTPNPLKHIEIGLNLVGLCHGNMVPKNVDKWLQVHAKEAWGRCKYVEVHKGHTHNNLADEYATITVKNKLIEDVGGVVIRTLPTICNASYWEHKMGYYSGLKAMMCFVWNEKTGLRETWYSCV